MGIGEWGNNRKKGRPAATLACKALERARWLRREDEDYIRDMWSV